MKQIMRWYTTFLYVRLAKPVLFRFSPDRVHAHMISLGRFTQRFPFVACILSAAWAHRRDEALLGQTVVGVPFKNPIGLSAGLDKNGEIIPTVQAIGFGFATVGSVTAKASDGNPRPWYHRLPKTRSIVVNAGLPNHGAATIRQRIDGYKDKTFTNFPLFVSIAKTNSPETCTDESGLADYISGVKQIVSSPHVTGLEINISCPNAYGGEPFTRPEPLEALLKEIDALHNTKPVTIKMPIDKPWKEFEGLLKVVVRHNVFGVTIGNLQKNRSKVQLKDPLLDSVPGNLSGAPCFEDSNELIRQTYKKYGSKLIITGSGGVFTAEDAYTKIKAGATLVDMITGVIFGGPQVVGQINHDLAKLLRRDGFANVSEAVGTSTR